MSSQTICENTKCPNSNIFTAIKQNIKKYEKCPFCNNATYCSQKCLYEDRPTHKNNCKYLQDLMQQAIVKQDSEEEESYMDDDPPSYKPPILMEQKQQNHHRELNDSVLQGSMFQNTSMTSSMDESMMEKIKQKRHLNDYKFIGGKNGVLGTGSFGEVKLAQDKHDNQLYAIKIMNKKNLFQHCSKEQIKREYKNQRKLSHPHVLKLFHAFEDQDNIYFILEYATQGSLFKYVKQKKKLNEQEAFVFFFQTCVALDYLHKKGILHRDLKVSNYFFLYYYKPENVLLDEDGNVKICDFGWSTDDIKFKRTTYCGTLEYMAPEMLTAQPHDFRVDVWSVGVLLFELTHGFAPFSQTNRNQKDKIYQTIDDLEKSGLKCDKNCSQNLKELLQGILKVKPQDRLTFKQIFYHKWIKQQAESLGNFEIEEYIYKPEMEIQVPSRIKEEVSLEHIQEKSFDDSFQSLNKKNIKPAESFNKQQKQQKTEKSFNEESFQTLQLQKKTEKKQESEKLQRKNNINMDDQSFNFQNSEKPSMSFIYKKPEPNIKEQLVPVVEKYKQIYQSFDDGDNSESFEDRIKNESFSLNKTDNNISKNRISKQSDQSRLGKVTGIDEDKDEEDDDEQKYNKRNINLQQEVQSIHIKPQINQINNKDQIKPSLEPIRATKIAAQINNYIEIQKYPELVTNNNQQNISKQKIPLEQPNNDDKFKKYLEQQQQEKDQNSLKNIKTRFDSSSEDSIKPQKVIKQNKAQQQRNYFSSEEEEESKDQVIKNPQKIQKTQNKLKKDTQSKSVDPQKIIRQIKKESLNSQKKNQIKHQNVTDPRLFNLNQLNRNERGRLQDIQGSYNKLEKNANALNQMMKKQDFHEEDENLKKYKHKSRMSERNMQQRQQMQNQQQIGFLDKVKLAFGCLARSEMK